MLNSPVQVVGTQPLRLALFADASSPRKMCTVVSPPPADILSIHAPDGSKRFGRSTFRVTGHGLTSSPPRKKLRQETSLEDRWQTAVAAMENASALEQEGLPALLSSYARGNKSFRDDPEPPAGPPHTPAAAKRSKSNGKPRSRPSASLKVDQPCDRTSCCPDPTLQIPGELVLARVPGSGVHYWPAKILSFCPGESERYRVQFLDEKVHVVHRQRMWTWEEEGFVTCPLGQWESAVKTTDDPESEDEEPTTRDIGGELALGSTPRPDDFKGLPAHAQLAYVKPVLGAILAKEYPPARDKHDAFMKGSATRAALLKDAGVRGGLDTRFIKAVQRAICRWVLGATTVDVNDKVRAGEDAMPVVDQVSSAFCVRDRGC